MSVKCTACGSELPSQVKFCIQCGAVVTGAQSPATENLFGPTRPLEEEKDYSTNVYTLPPEATEILSAPEPVKTGKTTQELTPLTGALPSQPKTVEKAFPKPGGLPSAPVVVAGKSGGRLSLAIVGIVLLLAAVIGGYALLRQSGNTPISAETASSPSPVVSAEASPVFSASEQVEIEAASKSPSMVAVEKQKNEIRQVAEKQPTAPVSKPEAASAVSAGTTLTESKEPAPLGELKSDAAGMAKSTPLPKVEQPKVSAMELLQSGLNAQNRGRHQEALSEFQKALQLDPANVSIYYLIGSSYHKLGQLEQALAAYRRCTTGPYASVSAEHVKKLEKKVGKSKY